jgi:hypothetical protein
LNLSSNNKEKKKKPKIVLILHRNQFTSSTPIFLHASRKLSTFLRQRAIVSFGYVKKQNILNNMKVEA